MKQRLLFFLLSILALVPKAFADDEVSVTNLTFVVDDADRVEISVNGEPIENIQTGSNVVEVTQWANISISPKADCTLVSVVDSQNKELSITNGSVQFMVYEAVPETYTITSKKESEVSFTVVVDNPAKVKMVNNVYNEIPLVAGENNFKMSPLNFPLLIGTQVYGDELYKVEFNGENLQPFYGSYSVTPVDGSVITIEANFPDSECNLTFTYPEGVANFFTAVTINDEMASDFAKGLKVKCGSKVALYYNPSCWDADENPVSVKINNEKQQWFWSGYSFVVKENTVVEVEQAQAVEMITVTIEADKPGNIKVYRNDVDTKDRIYLIAGVNTVELPKDDAKIVVTNVEADGKESKIKGITVNGTPAEHVYDNECTLNNLDPADVVKIFTEGDFEDTMTGVSFTTTYENLATGVYNLFGVKVADNTENLPRGIYIVNGRKMLIK